MNYCIVMKYSAKGNCYIVTVPDLPGCMLMEERLMRHLKM